MSEQVATSERLPAGLELRTVGRPTTAARRSSNARTLALVGIDAVAMLLAVLGAHAWSTQPLRDGIAAVVVLATMAAFATAGCYRPRATLPSREERRTLLVAPALIVMFAAAFELATTHPGAGDAGVRLWLLMATLVGTGRLGVAGAEALVRRTSTPTGRATLIVGAGHVGQTLAQRLVAEPQYGLQPIGFLDKEPLTGDDETLLDLPVLGASWHLEEVIAEHDVQHVIVAFSTAPPSVVLDIVRRCWRLGVGVMVVPRLFEVEGRRARVEHLGALPVVALNPSDPRSWQFTIKYAIDRIIASFVLLALSPVLAVLAVGTKLSSPGPIFFRQRRVGLDGHAFDMLKFRTMSGSPDSRGENDAAWAMATLGLAEGGTEAAPEDRRTRFGTFLRRTSMDELPQLWNVVRGDMSIIGPRPERSHYVEQFQDAIYRYPDRHRVKSGLTGWAQVNGLRGETSLQDRIEWDNFYIENWSPLLDLKIVLKTIPALLFARGDR
ncbi:exopolysaccharide biosynthesis polyprenyl glycosylphosphotransferase [Solirubrobacter phytolaccae]|uniref:Exopolysaccharide biosynthesis polyprenyl glycosylphosphotransferase n=1 Tax=Solirubrobacter phytolaccae TaxID=1404360 RepID=A0A9X3NAU7_9ACTN|nr:exopolysaccharide biosynthesis polyprenyl glycosylphosphotransferase [Solirubrobacter phytolaccae]MDA0182993.1 exopolysaccharide biosynthesis polyprenyl glycosylphosphotransferase [Solirubrobacter phytolaccae]